MQKKGKKVNKLAYLGLLGFLGILLVLYTKNPKWNPKWICLCGFFGLLGYSAVVQD